MRLWHTEWKSMGSSQPQSSRKKLDWSGLLAVLFFTKNAWPPKQSDDGSAKSRARTALPLSTKGGNSGHQSSNNDITNAHVETKEVVYPQNSNSSPS